MQKAFINHSNNIKVIRNGFTYIGLLIVIAIAGIGMAAVGVLWKTEMQREHEKELLFIGHEFIEAIVSYYNATPSGVKQLPKTLDNLITDQRLPIIKHHLRKLYIDPMTGKADWGLILHKGTIVGVYSLSDVKPLKTHGFEVGQEGFATAKSYRDWQFTYSAGI
ncbi:MAG: type II secretion system protein [Methylophilaceae bacterium]